MVESLSGWSTARSSGCITRGMFRCCSARVMACRTFSSRFLGSREAWFEMRPGLQWSTSADRLQPSLQAEVKFSMFLRGRTILIHPRSSSSALFFFFTVPLTVSGGCFVIWYRRMRAQIRAKISVRLWCVMSMTSVGVGMEERT